MNTATIFSSIIALLSHADPALTSLAFMVVIVIFVVASWHHSKDGFDLSQCIVDSTTGRISPEKVGYMTALAIMTWAFVALVMHDKMTEWYATVYAGLFVMGRLGSQYLTTKKDIANADPKPTP